MHMLREAYGNDASSKTTTYEWFKHFKNWRNWTDDNEQSGRPSTSRSEPLIAQVKSIVRWNRRLTGQKFAEGVRISTGSCQTIWTEYSGMHQVPAKCTPRLLTDQKLQQFSICENLPL
jgi:hypothetical protein